MQEDKDCPPFSREGHGPKSTDKLHDVPRQNHHFLPSPCTEPKPGAQQRPLCPSPRGGFLPSSSPAHRLIFLSSCSPASAQLCSPFNEVVL